MSDSFLKLGLEGRDPRQSICLHLRSLGFTETLYHVRSRIKLAEVLEFVQEMEATDRHMILVYCLNDLVDRYGRVHEIPKDLLALFEDLLHAIRAKSTSCVLVLPVVELFPKFRAVHGYIEARKKLVEICACVGVSVSDCSAYVSKMQTYDGEHFTAYMEDEVLNMLSDWCSTSFRCTGALAPGAL